MWVLRWSKSWDDESIHGSMMNDDINLVLGTAAAAIQEGAGLVVITNEDTDHKLAKEAEKNG